MKMSRRQAKSIAVIFFRIAWLPYHRERIAINDGSLRWRWQSFWEGRAMAWGTFWNNHLASPEEKVP